MEKSESSRFSLSHFKGSLHPEFRVNMGKELYDTMALGPHGKMGLHLKFKTIYNSVMQAKGLIAHKIP